MTSQPRSFEGPHLLRREELNASQRLSRLCFGGVVSDEGEDELPTWYHPPKRGGVYVITHQGLPVSQIHIFHQPVRLYDGLLRVGSVGGVCTHPDYRGDGLASRLLEHCTLQLAQEGARLMLISGMRGLYTRAGCVHAGKFETFTITPGKASSPQPDLRLRRGSAGDAALLSRLFQAEPVHFERQPAKFAAHLGRSDGYTHAETWIMEHGGQPMAYLISGIPWEYLHQSKAGVREVREYAGSRLALAGALEQVTTQGNLSQLTWPVPWQDFDLIQLLQAQGLMGTSDTLAEHTQRIINFPGLMADLRPYLQSRLEAKLRRGLRFEQSGPLLAAAGEDRMAIVRGRERLELDGGVMTRLVLGAPQAELGAAPVAAPGALAEVVAALFPLPSFLVGLNYQ